MSVDDDEPQDEEEPQEDDSSDDEGSEDESSGEEDNTLALQAYQEALEDLVNEFTKAGTKTEDVDFKINILVGAFNELEGVTDALQAKFNNLLDDLEAALDTATPEEGETSALPPEVQDTINAIIPQIQNLPQEAQSNQKEESSLSERVIEAIQGLQKLREASPEGEEKVRPARRELETAQKEYTASRKSVDRADTKDEKAFAEARQISAKEKLESAITRVQTLTTTGEDTQKTGVQKPSISKEIQAQIDAAATSLVVALQKSPEALEGITKVSKELQNAQKNYEKTLTDDSGTKEQRESNIVLAKANLDQAITKAQVNPANLPAPKPEPVPVATAVSEVTKIHTDESTQEETSSAFRTLTQALKDTPDAVKEITKLFKDLQTAQKNYEESLKDQSGTKEEQESRKTLSKTILDEVIKRSQTPTKGTDLATAKEKDKSAQKEEAAKKGDLGLNDLKTIFTTFGGSFGAKLSSIVDKFQVARDITEKVFSAKKTSEEDKVREKYASQEQTQKRTQSETQKSQETTQQKVTEKRVSDQDTKQSETQKSQETTQQKVQSETQKSQETTQQKVQSENQKSQETTKEQVTEKRVSDQDTKQSETQKSQETTKEQTPEVQKPEVEQSVEDFIESDVGPALEKGSEPLASKTTAPSEPTELEKQIAPPKTTTPSPSSSGPSEAPPKTTTPSSPIPGPSEAPSATSETASTASEGISSLGEAASTATTTPSGLDKASDSASEGVSKLGEAASKTTSAESAVASESSVVGGAESTVAVGATEAAGGLTAVEGGAAALAPETAGLSVAVGAAVAAVAVVPLIFGAAALATQALVSSFENVANQARPFVEALAPATVGYFDRSIRNVNATIGEALLPIFTVFAGSLERMAGIIEPIAQGLNGPIEQFAQIMSTTVLTVLQSMGTLFTALQPAIEAVVDIFDFLGGIIRFAAQQLVYMAQVASFVLLPLQMAVEALAFVFKAFTPVIDAMTDVFISLGAIFSALREVLRSLISSLFGGVGSNITSFFKSLADVIKTVIKNFVLLIAAIANVFGMTSFLNALERALAPPAEHGAAAAPTNIAIKDILAISKDLIVAAAGAGPGGGGPTSTNEFLGSLLTELRALRAGDPLANLEKIITGVFDKDPIPLGEVLRVYRAVQQRFVSTAVAATRAGNLIFSR